MKIQIIVGTTQPNRFSEKPAHWIFEEAKKRKDIEVELLDLRNYPLSFFDDPVSPSRITDGQYTNEVARKWAIKNQKETIISTNPFELLQEKANAFLDQLIW